MTQINLFVSQTRSSRTRQDIVAYSGLHPAPLEPHIQYHVGEYIPVSPNISAFTGEWRPQVDAAWSELLRCKTLCPILIFTRYMAKTNFTS